MRFTSVLSPRVRVPPRHYFLRHQGHSLLPKRHLRRIALQLTVVEDFHLEELLCQRVGLHLQRAVVADRRNKRRVSEVGEVLIGAAEEVEVLRAVEMQ